MREALQRAWLRRGPLAWALSPLSLAFGAIAALRRSLYRNGLLATTKLPVPVIVVGNVVAGGAGKTPVVIAVVEHLRARGLKTGVVSRGYGRSGEGRAEVMAHSDAASVGDEPLLVKRRTGVPVFVAAKRVDAARALLAAHPDTQVLVSDDGLQHYALGRDIEVCVFDERGIGNGWLLPAGPLREPWPRDVDLVLAQGKDVTRALAPHAIRADGTQVPLHDLRGRPLHAVAGTATPETFFRMLRDEGLQLDSCRPLPDHAAFDDVGSWAGKELVCTEKDAVKLWRLRPDAWAVPLAIQVDAASWSALDRLLDAKLSSRHGSQTA